MATSETAEDSKRCAREERQSPCHVMIGVLVGILQVLTSRCKGGAREGCNCQCRYVHGYIPGGFSRDSTRSAEDDKLFRHNCHSNINTASLDIPRGDTKGERPISVSSPAPLPEVCWRAPKTRGITSEMKHLDGTLEIPRDSVGVAREKIQALQTDGACKTSRRTMGVTAVKESYS